MKQQLPETVRPMLAGLRRYAWTLTGDRRTGDWYTRIALETLLEEPYRVRARGDVKAQLYRLFADVLSVAGAASLGGQDGSDADDFSKQGLLALPLLTRHLFLLITLEGFSVERAADLLGIAESEAGSHLAAARDRMRDRLGPVPHEQEEGGSPTIQ